MAITAAILVLVTQLLLRGPLLPERVAGVLMRVSFIPRPRSVTAPAPLPTTTTMTPEQARAILQAHAGDASADLAPLAAPGLPNERQLAEARKVLERPNPIQYDETRFAKDWVSDGTLGDVAAQKLNSAAATIAKKIFGEDIQSPVARPPPDVRYNPALYEQAADLGRAATGDAYKAAPIAYEKVPDLKGEGSRRIRVAMEALQKRISACDAAKVKPLMATVRSHLTELERVEYALAHGADPIQAQQMLPRRGDSNYDLARRALWFADHELASCKR